jgi:integrase
VGESVRPLGRAALGVLPARPGAGAGSYVFPGCRPDAPYGGLPGAWGRIAKKAGLGGEVTLHTLRHSFACTAADLNYSDATIGAMLGHASGTVTGRYIHHLDEVLVAAADRVAGEIWKQMTGTDGGLSQAGEAERGGSQAPVDEYSINIPSGAAPQA